MMSYQPKFHSTPLDGTEAIIWKVWDAHPLRQSLGDVEPRPAHRPGFVIPRYGEHHLGRHVPQILNGVMELNIRDTILAIDARRSLHHVLEEVPAVPPQYIRLS